MPYDSWTCPPMVARADIEADYEVMYVFEAQADKLGKIKVHLASELTLVCLIYLRMPIFLWVQ